MSEIKEAEIDVARLMSEIREAASRLKSNGVAIPDEAVTPHARPDAANGEQSSRSQQLPRLYLNTEAQQQRHDRYTLDELLQYYDDEFVENAYRVILKREPDEAGYKHYLESLRDGHINRTDVLVSLRSSAEGKEKNVRIIGLPAGPMRRRLYRLPVVGYFIEMLAELWRLPLRLHEQREFEQHSHLQQKQFAARHEQLISQQAETAAHINRVSEQIEATHAYVYAYLRKLDEQLARLAELEEERRLALSEKFEERAAELDERLRAGMKELSGQMQAHAEHFAQHAEQVAQRLQSTRAELIAQEKRTLRLLESAPAPVEAGDAPHASTEKLLQAAAEEKRYLSDAFYASFEEHFRGSREEIIKRLRVYLPVLRKGNVTGGVLDIGTGRGEWLELLRDEGIGARGVDTNLVQVEVCRARGLRVTHTDALTYLRGLPDNQLHAVTGFHVIEHLEFESLVALMDEILRVLVPGGICLFETPNPENVSVTGHNFYVDPTHRSPLPIPLMKYLFESRGYCKIEVMRLHPSDTPQVIGDGDLIARFNDYFYGAMDYAIIGSKA